MEVQKLRPGLWRWTAPHPAWRPADDWPREVGCVYLETDAATVLVDPLVPAGEEERFWLALDRDVERRGVPVVVALTAAWHRRSADEVAPRYAGEIWPAWEGERPIPEVEPLPVGLGTAAEAAFFVPRHRALLVGDVLESHRGQLDVWRADDMTAEALVPLLHRLRETEPELIVVGHGPPVLENAAGALEGAVARFTQA